MKAPDASAYRKAAGRLLACRGNRLAMILAVLVVLFVIVPYLFLDLLYVYLVQFIQVPMGWSETLVYGWINIAYWLVMAIFAWFFALPLAYGLLYMGTAIAREEDVVLADVFHSFASAKNYFRAVSLAFSLVWRVLIAAAVVYITYNAFIYASGGNLLILLIGAPIILIEIVLTLVLSAGRFYTAYFVYAEGLSVRAARKQSRILTKQCRGGAYSYVVDYLLSLLLGFATAGITLIIDTLPRMLISYVQFCKATQKRFNQSEEIKDHE